MANTIRLKSGSGSNPSASDLVVGEVALRTDGNPKLFTKNDAGNVLEVGLDSLNDKLPLTGGTITGNLILDNATNAGRDVQWQHANDRLAFFDNTKATFGNGADLEIKHTGSDSRIINSGSDLFIYTVGDHDVKILADSQNAVICKPDAAVELYYDNSKKLETTSTGIKITSNSGDISVVTDSTGSALSLINPQNVNNSDVKFGSNYGNFSIFTGGSSGSEKFAVRHDGNIQIPNDNARLKIGAGQDLQLYHNGNDSFVRDLGTGGLYMTGSVVGIRNSAANEDGLLFAENAAVQLFYDNTKKFETTSGGISITGDITGTGHLDLGDDAKLKMGASDDLEIFHSGGNSFIANSTGYLLVNSEAGDNVIRASNDVYLQPAAGEFGVKATANGATELYYDNSKKLETTSGGVDVDGSVTADDIITAGALLHEGDTDTLVHFSAANTIELKTGGVSRLAVTNAGLALQNGYFNSNGNRIILGDSSGANDDRLVFGNNNDLEVYHDGTQSYIKNATGNLDIITGSTSIDLQGNDGSETLAKFQPNGSVELYHDNSKKFETSSTGATVTGTLTATTFSGSGASLTNIPAGQLTGTLPALDGSNLTGLTVNNANTLDNLDSTQFLRSDAADTASGDITFTDNTKAKFGTGSDLQIYHSGSHSFIDDVGTGDMYIRGDNALKIQNAAGSEQKIVANSNGSVDLYYDHSKKLETTSNGVKLPDSSVVNFGNSSDLQIYHDGTNSAIQNSTGDLYLYGGTNNIYIRAKNDEDSIIAKPNNAVELYYDNSKKLETTSTGASVTGALGVGVASPTNNNKAHLRLADSSIATPSNQSVLLVENNTNTWITIGSGASSYGGILFGDSGNAGRGQVRFNHNGDIMQMIAQEEKLFQATLNGAAELYYDNSKKLETQSGGITVNGNANFGDNKKTVFGDGSDLKIYHDGSNSYINDSGTGALRYLSNTHYFANAALSEIQAQFISNGAVELYYDNSLKLYTMSSGVIVSGDLLSSSNVKVNDNGNLIAGSGNDLQIYHNGTHSYIENATGGLYIKVGNGEFLNRNGTEVLGKFLENGAVELYYDNSKKLQTDSDGVEIFGNRLRLADNVKAAFGSGADLQIYHDGSNSYLQDAGTGDLIIKGSNNLDVKSAGDELKARFITNGAVELYYDNGKRIETTTYGITVTGNSNNPTTDAWDTNSSIITSGSYGGAIAMIDGSRGFVQYLHGNGVNWELRNAATNSTPETNIKAIANNAVELYYDNSKKFETTSGGATVTGNLFATNKFRGNDNVKVELGTGNNFQIYHNSGFSYIDAQGDQLRIDADQLRVRSDSGESYIEADANSAVKLYFDNAKKFETTSEGIQVTSNSIPAVVVKSTGSNRADLRILAQGTGHAYLWMDASNGDLSGADYAFLVHKNDTLDLELANYANDIILKTRNGSIGSGGLNTAIHCHQNGAVELYHDGSKKFETTSSGVSVTGNASTSNAFVVTQTGGATLSENLSITDSGKAKFGTSDDLQIYHDGSESVIGNSTGTFQILSPVQMRLRASNFVFAAYDNSENLAKFTDNGSVQLYYDNSEKLYTTADGIESKGELHFKSPSNFNGEQTGRIEWWNENDAGVMAKIGVDRKSSTGAPADLVFSTSQNVDTSANGSDGDITERGRFSNNGLRLTNQPCFYAYSGVTRNNYGGGIVVAYTATHHNQGNHYSTSTYRFTAPVDGIYVFGGNPGYVESGQTYSLYFRINGAVRTEVGRVVQGNFPSHSQFGFSVSVKLSANDYVDLYQGGRMHHNASYSAWWGYFLG